MTSAPQQRLAEIDELELLRAAAQCRALMRTGMEVQWEVDEPALIAKALDFTWSLLRADVAALLLVEEGGEAPRLRGLRTTEGVQLVQEAMPASLFAPEAVGNRPGPFELRLPGSWSALSAVADGRSLPALRSALVAPLRVRGCCLGYLAVAKERAESFRPDHVEVLAVLAQQVALALDNAHRLRGAEQQGRQAQELLDSIADGLIVVDARLRVVYLNRAASALLGQPLERARGRPVSEVMPLLDESGSSLPPDTQPFARGVSEGRAVSQTAILRLRQRGQALPVAVSVAPVRRQDGQTAYAVGVYHDILREKELERRKTEFVSIASHEIRTPLAALRGFTELLLSRDVSPEVQRDWLSVMNRESTRLATLIEDLLDLTRIESGCMALRPERVRIDELARRVVALLETHEKRPRFTFCADPHLPEVMADGGKLTQVLQNLVSNAINYSSGRPSVHIEASRGCLAPAGVKHLGRLASDDASRCPGGPSVAVRDRGVGIALDQLRRVFDPFYRVQAGEPGAPNGTGLGLTIAKALVERHGGRMWVESTPGCGSTFGFCLPTQPRPGRSDGGIAVS